MSDEPSKLATAKSPRSSKLTLYTIGHSTRSWEEFVALLKTWQITDLVDVRTVPKSRKYPWFSIDNMARQLPLAAIAYTHMKSLGGFRHLLKDSPNMGWQNESFRGYADYTTTPAFAAAIDELNQHLRTCTGRLCIMCSEAVWWRCHRRLISDAEVERGIIVHHIMSEHSAPLHELTSFAVVKKHRGKPPTITYPPPIFAQSPTEAEADEK